MIKVIASKDNQIYKILFQLKQKKNRDKMGKYIIEGPNLIAEALNNGGEIDFIVCSENFDIKEENVPVYSLKSELFNKLSDTDTPQGVMAVVKKKIYSEEEFFKKNSDGSSNIIVFDRLQDPGNIGTIIRTADAAGYMGAIILKGTGDIYSPKIVRAAAGSLFRLPVLMTETSCQTLNLLKKYKKKIICTSLNCNNYYYDIMMAEDVAVVIGNEGNGVCDDFFANSDVQVKIPMHGTIESLNAAVSAGILMYESVRQKLNK